MRCSSQVSCPVRRTDRPRCEGERGCLETGRAPAARHLAALAPLPAFARPWGTVILRTCVQVCAGISTESFMCTNMYVERNATGTPSAVGSGLMFCHPNSIYAERGKNPGSSLSMASHPPPALVSHPCLLAGSWMNGGACIERMMCCIHHL